MESITQLLATLLTEKETVHVINRLNFIQEHLKKKSSTQLLTTKCHHEMSCNAHAFRGLSRTFIVSFLVKHVIYAVPLLRKDIKNIFKWKWDNVKFAMFLSSYVSLYRVVLCNLTHHSKLKYRSFCAGFVAGMSILLDTNKKRRNGIVWFICARSLYAGAKLIIHKSQSADEAKIFEIFDSQTSPPLQERSLQEKALDACDKYGSVLFMAANCSLVLYNLTMHPLKVPKSMRDFIFYVGGVQERYGSNGVDMMRLIKSNLEVGNMENCSVIHPNKTCEQFYPLFFFQVFARCLRIYMPLSLGTAIFFKYKSLKNHLKQTLSVAVKSALQSCVFMSALSTTLYFTVCVLRRTTGKEFKWYYMINGFLSGCWIIIEPYGRRTELALYMLPRALETIFPKINKLEELLLFCTSTGVMMHVYEGGRIKLGTQGKVMTRIFGVA